MGWQVGAACYGTELAAAQALAASQAGVVLSTPAGLYALVPGAITGTSIEWQFAALDGGPAKPAAVVGVVSQPCGLLEWQDALQLGWSVVAAWALVYGIRFLIRTVRAAYDGPEHAGGA